jgi:hypothetical protein
MQQRGPFGYVNGYLWAKWIIHNDDCSPRRKTNKKEYRPDADFSGEKEMQTVNHLIDI